MKHHSRPRFSAHKGNLLRNCVMAAACVLGGCHNLQSTFYREVRERNLDVQPGQDAVVTEGDIASLPIAAQRYFHFMGAVGVPRTWSLHVAFEGRFKRSPTSDWAPCQTVQYNSRDELARLFYMTIRVGPIPMLGRDTYVRGRGRMLGRAFDLVTVVDGSGSEFNISELVTYLNDAVLMAPSMLLGQQVQWKNVDDTAFDVAITDHGQTVAARVFLDERGAPIDFSTTDRFIQDKANAKQYVRMRWTTPIDGYMDVHGRRVPVSGKAIWHPEGGEPLVYAEFRTIPDSVAFNLRPGTQPSAGLRP
jgi:hypothetical protein